MLSIYAVGSVSSSLSPMWLHCVPIYLLIPLTVIQQQAPLVDLNDISTQCFAASFFIMII